MVWKAKMQRCRRLEGFRKWLPKWLLVVEKAVGAKGGGYKTVVGQSRADRSGVGRNEPPARLPEACGGHL